MSVIGTYIEKGTNKASFFQSLISDFLNPLSQKTIIDFTIDLLTNKKDRMIVDAS